MVALYVCRGLVAMRPSALHPFRTPGQWIEGGRAIYPLLLGVLRHPQEAGCGLGFDPLKCCRPFGRITVAHPIPRVSRPPGPRKRQSWKARLNRGLV